MKKLIDYVANEIEVAIKDPQIKREAAGAIVAEVSAEVSAEVAAEMASEVAAEAGGAGTIPTRPDTKA